MHLKHVPASTGIQWVKRGIQTFFRQPFAISGLFFMFMAGLSLMSVVPFLGSLVAIVITPAATLGLMAASRKADQGEFPMPSTLITAFRQGTSHSRNMLMLGGLYATSLLLLVAVAFLLGPDLPEVAGETGLTPEMLATVFNSPGLWLSGSLYVPILMMFWHAPALVHWHGVAPVKSLFFSLVACWTNKGALTLYMLAWLGLLVAAMFVITLFTRAFGAETVGFLLYPLVLLFASVFYASLWFTFQDSFEFDGSSDLIN